jgi:hypothetical protein
VKIDIELLDICPKCKRVTRYYPNPMYMHKCEHCYHECSQDDLISGFDIDEIEKALKEIASYKNRFAYVRKGRMIRKPRRATSNA